ncbi:MAG: response regulator [Acidobacteria bacterium]|nr:response regulator [Acidobacteriota bacterium]
MATVLLVEDDPDQLDLRRLILETAGYTVLAAKSSAEALAHPAADVGVLDLRIPTLADGLSLIEKLQERAPSMKLIVISGWTQDLPDLPAKVDKVLEKPVKTKSLLQHIARLAVLLLCATGVPATEMVAHLELSAPGTDWEIKGKEAVLADIEVDGKVQQQLMLYAGARRHRYSVFLGDLPDSPHKVTVKGANIVEHSIITEPAPAWTSFAPVLFERKNAIGKFTDIPILTYTEQLRENGQQVLQYTVIFSNEDGGTSTRSLMARWGRTTDIEYVYRAYLKADGTLDKAIIQSRGHQDIEFKGPFFGTHPMLMPVTDNNMVAGEGPSAVRYQPAPVLADLSATSREAVMDANPITWLVMTSELVRENKLRAYGEERGETISDPRNYLYVEAKVQPGKAAIAFVVLHANGKYYFSHKGRARDAIERAGWVRSTIEFPPGTKREDLRSITALCVYLPKTPSDASCGPTEIKSLFFLTPEKLPGPTFQLPIGNN